MKPAFLLLRSALLSVTSTLVFAMLTVSMPASASPIINAQGKLVGATRVDLGALGYYNVRFLDGTCIEVFSGCDEASDFDFHFSTETISASQALLDQVFIGNFDDDPALTFGCSDVDICAAFTPTLDLLQSLNSCVYGTAAVNLVASATFYPFDDFLGPHGFYGCLAPPDFSFDDTSLTGDGSRVWARWSVWTDVPEPATLALVGAALFGLAASRKRRLAVTAA